ncbi:MAG TPA: helix-turn-helix transcriptional regulator [Hanamia sp.]|nr:helix-turn-helix transcriptional regulator [Hanamia sp.]
MRIGDNIREIRESEKNLKRSYVAEKLHITTRAYSNIENNITDITLNRLEGIASVFECSLLYILNYKQAKKEFYNYFHNNNGNCGINIMNQGGNSQDYLAIQNLKDELIESEKKRIDLLEALLKNNNVNF